MRLGSPDEEVWAAHQEAKAGASGKRTFPHWPSRLDPEAFTIGFARRSTPYKRADLVLSDLDRLRYISARHGRRQLVFAGKAHPRDEAGKEIIRHVFAAARTLGDTVRSSICLTTISRWAPS